MKWWFEKKEEEQPKQQPTISTATSFYWCSPQHLSCNDIPQWARDNMIFSLSGLPIVTLFYQDRDTKLIKKVNEGQKVSFIEGEIIVE